MDIQSIKISIKRVFTDRSFLFLLAGLFAACLMYLIVIGLNIRVSDVTVYSRYTAFGMAHFYKDHWQYHLLFLLFGLVVTVSHASIMIKLHNLERRQTAVLVGWMGIVILLIAMFYVLSVMGLGRGA